MFMTKNIACVILMLLLLMSKDPVLSTVSVRESVHWPYSVFTSVKLGCAVEKHVVFEPSESRFSTEKASGFSAVLSSGITICGSLGHVSSLVLTPLRQSMFKMSIDFTHHHPSARPRTTKPISLKKELLVTGLMPKKLNLWM